jgi:PKD repeat protein
MNESIIKKCLSVMFIFVIFLSFTTIIVGKHGNRDFSINTCIFYPFNNINNGTLSGYVYDIDMDPVREARVRVYFHGNYEEDYTDVYGYYYVSNIPICYCLKNCTASKEGYSDEWVMLPIYENSTYDFVLNCVSMQVDVNGPYYGIVNEPVQFTGSVSCGNEPYTWFWDFGDGNTSNEQCHLHNYSAPGNYLVNLNVIDNESTNDSEITYAFIEDAPNHPPEPPLIIGPLTGIIGEKISYSILTSDPEKDDVFYEILWGDGTFIEWFGPFLSDEAINVNHTWSEMDVYKTMVRAKDVNGNIGEWTSINVIIKRNRGIMETIWTSFMERLPILGKLLFFTY